MLIYLATYPRSGNSLLQSVIVQGLRRRPSQIRAVIDEKFGEKFGARVQATPIPWPEEVIWDERTAVFEDGDVRRRVILPGPLDYLTPERRRAFAAEDEMFIVKLHELPFESYFEGEKVIQVVRDPGAVLWSYFRYLVDFLAEKDGDHIFDRPPPTLARVIDGDVPWGDWSDYHRKWLQADLPRLEIRYESLASDPSQEIDRIAAFAGVPVKARNFTDFASYASRFAGKDLRGTSEGYEQFLTPEQLSQIGERHREMIRHFGYQEPDPALGCASLQVKRLEALIEIMAQYGANFDAARKEAIERLKELLVSRAKRDGA